MREEKVLYNAVVCYLARNDEFLMAFKTEKIGAGCWNGYGGGIETGETPVMATVREFWEETHPDEDNGVVIYPENLEKIAEIDFHNMKSNGEIFVCKVHFYLTNNWSGEPKDTKTMINPTWFSKDNLPKRLMPADLDFLPKILTGKKIKATYYYGPFQKELIKDSEVEYVDSFED